MTKSQIFVDLSPLPGGGPDEEWRIILDWPEYAVSSYGRVRSFPRLAWNGKGYRRTPSRLLKPWVGKVGYPVVALQRDRQSRKFLYIHRLVLEAFVGPCPEGMEACHNDGNKTNNHVSNLRWDTASSNITDQYLHGRRTKLTREQVLDIRARARAGEDYRLADELGLNASHVRLIRLGRIWKHALPPETK